MRTLQWMRLDFKEMPQVLVSRRGQGGGDEAVSPGTHEALLLRLGYKLFEAPKIHPQLHFLKHSSVVNQTPSCTLFPIPRTMMPSWLTLDTLGQLRT